MSLSNLYILSLQQKNRVSQPAGDTHAYLTYERLHVSRALCGAAALYLLRTYSTP